MPKENINITPPKFKAFNSYSLEITDILTDLSGDFYPPLLLSEEAKQVSLTKRERAIFMLIGDFVWNGIGCTASQTWLGENAEKNGWKPMSRKQANEVVGILIKKNLIKKSAQVTYKNVWCTLELFLTDLGNAVYAEIVNKSCINSKSQSKYPKTGHAKPPNFQKPDTNNIYIYNYNKDIKARTSVYKSNDVLHEKLPFSNKKASLKRPEEGERGEYRSSRPSSRPVNDRKQPCIMSFYPKQRPNYHHSDPPDTLETWLRRHARPGETRKAAVRRYNALHYKKEPIWLNR